MEVDGNDSGRSGVKRLSIYNSSNITLIQKRMTVFFPSKDTCSKKLECHDYQLNVYTPDEMSSFVANYMLEIKKLCLKHCQLQNLLGKRACRRIGVKSSFN